MTFTDAEVGSWTYDGGPLAEALEAGVPRTVIALAADRSTVMISQYAISRRVPPADVLAAIATEIGCPPAAFFRWSRTRVAVRTGQGRYHRHLPSAL